MALQRASAVNAALGSPRRSVPALHAERRGSLAAWLGENPKRMHGNVSNNRFDNFDINLSRSWSKSLFPDWGYQMLVYCHEMWNSFLCRILIAVAALAIGTLPPAAAQSIKVTITADNAYNLGYGTMTGVTNLEGDVENATSAAQIFSCGSGPEVYNVPYVANGYFYIVAYSDKSGTQGLLAQFAANGMVTYSGASAWQVYATGVNYDPGSGGPTLTVINQQIAVANAGTGGSGSSHGWVGLAGGPAGAGYVGTLAVGEANNSATGDFPQACPTSLNPGAANAIDDAARWMWYNPSGLADPFNSNISGVVAGEFLIFRLPFSEVVNPRCIGINKDIVNGTSQHATGVDILVGGHHSQYSDVWPPASQLSFNVVPSGANDLLRWTGANVAPGAIVHVGFKLPEPTVDILGLFMTQGTTEIGCGHQVNLASGGTHYIDGGSGSNIILTNNVSACESLPLYVGNLTLKYFPSEVDLGLLNPTAFGTLTPIRTDVIPGSPTLVNPGTSGAISIPAPPAGANWAAAHYTVGTSATLTGTGNTDDFVLFPVPAGSAPAGNCAASPTAICLEEGRFQVTASFDAGGGNSGSANGVQLTPDTGYLWFFANTNVEAVVKVLNGCGVNGHYWFFAGGLTDVKVTLTVVDTKTATTRTYVNPQSTAFQPIQDTSAFATCP
jgi:hypothetical protein